MRYLWPDVKKKKKEELGEGHESKCNLVTYDRLLGQQTKEKVKLLIQLADSFVEKGHIHATEIRKWVTTVDKHYRDFSLRMGKYRYSLEKALGVNTEVSMEDGHPGHPLFSSPSVLLLSLLWKEARFPEKSF